MNRCDICLEENCKGKHNCHCETCSKIRECYRVLHPTIRITNKCTQECSHCCFCSNPESKIMMTIDMAKNIAKFLKSNEIPYINVMGGEFACNPDWYEILDVLASSTNLVRLVSNGDWVVNDRIREKFLAFAKKYEDRLQVSISNDSFHTNENVAKVQKWLEDNDISHNVGTSENMSEDAVVPVGRGEMHYGVYNMFSCYCHNPVNMYAFLIDENGEIYKCGFGNWNYANVKDYLDGGFATKFKEFNKKFYSLFIPSCESCVRVAKKDKRTVLRE